MVSVLCQEIFWKSYEHYDWSLMSSQRLRTTVKTCERLRKHYSVLIFWLFHKQCHNSYQISNTNE